MIKMKENESRCTLCGKLIRDSAETKWSKDAEPYCKRCFKIVEKIIDKSFTEDGKPICPGCGKVMLPAYDKIAKKVTGYEWYCPCNPGIHLCIC